MVGGPTEMSASLKSQLVSTQKQFTIQIDPKPIATSLETVLVEGVQTPFNVGLNNGYTHEFSALAEKVNFQDAQYISPNTVRVNSTNDRGIIQGTIACSGGICDLNCTSGNCGGVFTPNTGLYSNTSLTQYGCTAAGANCPTLTYKATVRTGSGLLAQSENTGDLRFNVRPKPRASAVPVNLMAAEGESIGIELKNTSGYTHPFYGAKSITKQGATHGDISSAFVCQTVAGVPGVCTSTFAPTVGFQPTLADHNATLTYKVTVNDTTEINPAVGPQTVGDLLSPDIGTVTIEYRPTPRATTVNIVGRQDLNTGITLALNQGYTHTYNTAATKMIIVANTYSHATVQGCTTNNDCTITCAGGICNATLVPDAGFYGTASFQYKIAIDDNAFSPTRELISPNTGTVSVDVRPLPIAYDLSFATKLNTAVTMTIKPLASLGYTHPYGDKAKSITITSAISNGSITTPFTCDTSPGSPTFGECSGIFTPNSNFFGQGGFSYFVTTHDNTLNADVSSTIKNIVINVRPEPVATGYVSNATTWENQDRNISIANGLLIEKKGYYYPNDLAPEYDLHPYSILIDTPPSASLGSFPVAFSCSSGIAPKACNANYVVSSNTYGTTSLAYRVRIQDPVLSSFVTSNSATISLETRPIPRAFDTSFTNNIKLKAIEGTPLNWEINNSSTQGYTYPTAATYSSVLNTLVIVTTDIAGGNGVVQVGASCSNGVCSGVFTPDVGYSGNGASFKFKVGVTDSTLPTGNQYYETAEKTASIDVYPRPIANNFTLYTLEDSPINIAIAPGASLGYTHARSHAASNVHVTQVTSGNALLDNDFICSAGTCTASFTPTNGFSSVNNNVLNAASVKFQVDVTETGMSPRTARSNNEGLASIIVYPKPIVSVGATLTNISAWEGENTPVSVAAGTGLGYTHAWGDQAQAVSIEGVSAGSALVGAFSCAAGTCSNQFVPKEGVYGNGAAYYDYKVKTLFASLADPNAWSASPGRVTFNVRAVPKVPASFAVTGVENTNLVGQTISLNNGYTYGDSASRSISKIELREFNNTYTHVTCQGGCTQYTCTAGTCTLPQLVPELDYDRTDGTAKLEYRVMVHDELYGAGADKWSTWSTLNVSLLPMARGSVVDRSNAIEATPYSLTINLNDGYTHVESLQATKIRIKGGTNLSGLSIGSQTDCVAGVCTLTINPITTGFADIAGKPTNGGLTFGWAALDFDVLVPVDGNNIWSTQGKAQIYFRPVPKPDNVNVATAIENEPYDVTIRLTGTGSCVSGCGYTHAFNHFATAIAVSNANATVQGTPSCNATNGVCTVRLFNATPGTYSFNYKVTVDGLQQIDAGTAFVTFVPRPRTENLSAITVEERFIDININRGAGLGYTHVDNHDAKDVIVSNVSNGTVQQVLDGVNGTACTAAGASVICNCRAAEPLCVVRFTPRTWIAGENTVMGGFDFKVRDSLYKESDGTTPLASMNQSTVTIEERPIPRAHDVSYASNVIFKAIEGTNLSWQISNGSGLGYIYSTDPKYNTVRATTQITTADVAGGHGSILASPSCTNGVCSGTFIPEVGYSGTGASFNFLIAMTDAALPAGTQTLQTQQKTAFVDIYPRPVANNFTTYTVQNTPLNVSIAKGAGVGYTHARNDGATAISVIGTTQTTALSGSDFSCSSGTCTATVTPATNYYSADATLPNAASFDFKVSVTEAGASPRTAQSTNTGKASIVVYPKPIASVGASLTNIDAWEGEAASVAIAPGSGLGYTHAWNDLAQGISISGVSTGSQIGTAFTCSSGACSGTFIPKEGTYGNGAASFDFNVRTVYNNLTDPNVWAAATGHVTFDVRAVPKVPASISFTGIENTNLTTAAVSLNNGYTYGDSINRNISKLEVREYQGIYNHITCQGGCTQYTCTAGTCTFPQLVPETNYDRTDGTAKLEYRVMVHDELFGAGTDKWSPWATVNVPLLPMARGTVVDRLTAIEATPYALSVNLSDGYSHVENAKATKIRVVGGTNLSGLSIGNETDCVNGLCTVTVNPITTAFADIAGKPTNSGLTFGWATFDYQVLVPVDGVNIWSTQGTAQIYFRPVPKPDNVTVATAIENEAYDVKIRLTGTGSCSSGCGYSHAFNHLATAIAVSNATATVQGTPSCDSVTGICTVRFYSLNAGTFAFNYKVTVDGLQQIDAGTASVTFIPRPRTENLSAITVEERSIDININRGVGLGYTHTDSHNAQDVVVSNISNGTIQQVTDGVNGVACTVAGSTQICSCRSGEALCVVRFTPRTWVAGENTVMGGFDFKVRDSIYKEADGTTPLASMNQSTVTIEERPIPRTNDASYTSNVNFKAIENTNLTWQIANGAGMGYTYSLDPKYASVRATTQIATTDVAGGHGTISPTPSCTNGVCTGIFVPEANYNGSAATFKFSVTMTDTALPAGTQTLTTIEKTATIDVYPRPVSNNITTYTAQNLPVSITLTKGTGVGYTHLRNDDASAISIPATFQLAALAGGDFTCSAGACSATVTPATNYYSTDATVGNAAYFDFKASVTETGASPRIAQSTNTGRAYLTVYPRSIPSVGSTLTNVPAWEGEAAAVSLTSGTGLGYTHPWGDLAQAVNVTGVSTGSSVTTAITCSAGICNGGFTPKVGTYGNGAAYFDYQTKTVYNNLTDPNVWSSSTGRVTYNVRAVPNVPASTAMTGVENTDVVNQTIGLNSGYTYGDSANRSISKIELREYQNVYTHITCEGGCTQYNCTTGTCTLPALIPELDYDRTDGTAKLEYRVMVHDEQFGAGGADKWSNWASLNLSLLPMARGSTVDRTDGIEATSYNVVLTLNNGYTHVEGKQATKIQLVGDTNLSGIVPGTLIDCVNGTCTVPVTPITTNFANVAGKPANNGTFGWAQLDYKVLVPVDGVDIWSTQGAARVYFRPVPKPENITVSDAIEDETKTVEVRLNGTGGCSSGCGYTHAQNGFASSITVFNSTASVQGTPTCNSSTGVCSVNFYSANYGDYSFQYKVTVNGVQQIDAGTATVSFLPRPRTVNLTTATIEGNPIDIQINRGPTLGYTHAHNHNAQDVVVSSITNGTIQQVLDGVNGTACAVSGSNQICSCRSGESLCVIRYTPRAWASGEGVLSGAFNFKVRDSIYKESDGITPLASKNQSSVSITMNPRIVANSRSYPAGTTQGVEDATKTVQIAAGAGGASVGGYIHSLTQDASQIEIVTMTNATISGCAGDGCYLNCTTGTCNVNVVPLSGASFTTNASFTYHIHDANGFVSHVPGNASVYFYPRPKGTSRSIVVGKNSIDNTLTIQLNDGFTHLLNDNPSSWVAIDSANLNGTLNTYSCSGTSCTVKYTPTTGYTSPDPVTLSSFTYSVTNNTASGGVTSNVLGTYNIEVFPAPVATGKTLYWVENIGDQTKPAGQEQKITIRLNQDYTHERGYNPKSILTSNVTGGSFSSPFACSADTCTATFIPSLVAANNSTPASYFDYQVKVVGSYDNLPSNAARVNIVVMPVPTAKTIVVTGIQGESFNFKFANFDNFAGTPKVYDSYSHAWSATPIDPTDIEIIQQPLQGGSQVGTVSMQNCSGGQCLATYTPATGAAYGIAQFRFRVKVKDLSQPGFWAWTNTADATVDLTPYYTVTGRNYSTSQVVHDDGFGNLSVIPNTEVAITINLGNGYTQAHNVANLGALKFLNTFTSAGSIINASVSGGQWTGTFRSTDYWFGDIYLQYQVCATNCDVATDIKSPIETDQAKWVHIYIAPSDIPPVACAKTAADSLVVYKNTAKAITLNKADQCANGVWYKDMNNGDLISSITFYDPLPPGTIAGGNDTTCVTSGLDRVCTCGTQACAVLYTPPLDMVNNYTVNYKVKTHSTLLNIETPSNDFAALTFNIVNPLTPVAQDLTFNISEDVPLNIALTPGNGYLTAQQINATYLPAPDGYPMVATGANIVSYDTNMFSSVVVTDCTSGTCNLAITPKVDASGAGLITYNVVANGLTSANKTITINIGTTNDAPNTYGLAQTDLRFNRRQLFAVSWGRNEGTFYQNGVGQPVTLTLYRWNGHPSLQSIGQGSWTNQVYGYFDVDSDNATKIRIGTITGGTINYAVGKDANDAFTCDVNGTCTAEFIPNGSVINNYASFSYWVTAGGQEQPASSAFNVYVAGTDTPPVAFHLPDHNTQDPDINNTAYNPDFVLPRNGTLNVLIRRGTTDAYTKNMWLDYPNTELAGKVEIGDGTNGAAAPSGLTLGQNVYTCSAGSCVIDVHGLQTYASFPTEANFWYRVVSNEGYVYNGYNFGNNLRTYSAWKKVTFKVVLNAGVGCDATPVLQYDRFITESGLQGQSINFSVGSGGVAGNGYSHTGTGANWRPLKEIQIMSTANGSVTTIDCTTTFGVCTGTFNPAGVVETPSDPNDDYVGHWPSFQIKALDDYGCPSTPVYWYANIQPKISTRGVCEFDALDHKTCIRDKGAGPNVAQNSAYTLQFRKRDTKAQNDFNNYEYETYNNANATKVVLYNFNNQTLMRSPADTAALTGAGVSCSTASGSLVCETTNCDAAGTCLLTFNSTNSTNWGELSFKYKVYSGTTVSNGIWGRYPQNYWPYFTNNLYFHEGDADHTIFIKGKPVVTNPSAYVMGVNDTIDIQIGKEDAPNGVHGYTYADTTNFANQDVQINFSGPVNGSILESSFDQTTRIATLRFRPDFNFTGTATLNYRVTVWGVQSDLGTISISVPKYLSVSDALTSTSQDTVKVVNIDRGTQYTYQTPYAFDAIAMEVADSTYNTTIPGTEGSFSAPSCIAGGNCSTSYTPPAGFFGTKAFKYRLKAGNVGSQYWSPWMNLTIDVLQSEVPPVVYGMNLTGDDETAKLISISKAPSVATGSSYGYTDANNDLATKLYVSNLMNGSVSPASPVTCSNGICLVSFTPTAGYYGNATFDFNVEANAAQATTPATITVNFVPQLRATSVSATTSRNQAKVLTIAQNAGYTYNPGALVTDIEFSNILPAGSTATGTCASGSCTVTFTPAANYSGAASFNYVVKIISGGTTLKTSNSGTASITVNATDTAPVAADLTDTLPNHNPYVITRTLGGGYTDAEGDKATAITIVSSTGTSAIADNSCNAAGTCTFTFSPLAGFAGTAEVTYKVTANGLNSNTAKIRLTVPVDNSQDFNLSWNGAPTVNDSCQIAIPGQIQLLQGAGTCGQTSCTASTGLIDTKITTSVTTSSYTGISGIYNKIGTLGEFLTQWQVTATGGQSASLYRYLNLAEGTPSTIKGPTLSFTPAPEMAIEGSQMLTGGCTGTSCSSQKLGSLASGNGFSCSLMPDSSIQCWGSNAHSKLGYNNTVDTQSLTPVTVRDPYDPNYDLIGALDVTAGDGHACALLTNRRVICWGDNTYGQLGNNTSGADSAAPVFVSIDGAGTPLTAVAAISAGSQHTCAVTQGRKAYCWGRNNVGQLGNGSMTDSLIATPVKKVTSKTGETVNTVVDMDAIFTIAAATDHTCAVRMDLDGSNNIVDSKALCWGANDRHQVGDHNYYSATETDFTKVGTGAGYGSEDNRLYPVMVRDNTDTAVGGVIGVVTGEKVSCALTNSGSVKCWGANDYGQTGTNNATYTASIDVTTVTDAAGTGTLSNVATLTAGKNQVCALHKNRTVSCWGSNTNGELGDNSTTGREKPVAVTGTNGTGTLNGVFAISAGFDHTCALTSTGSVQCFGKNNFGQLGVNDAGIITSIKPTPGVVNSDASAFHGSLRECSKVYQITVP